MNIEQPPANTPPELSSYLLRMFNAISREVAKDPTLIVNTSMPKDVAIGMIRYFKDPIPPTISSAGVWFCVNDKGNVWQKIL